MVKKSLDDCTLEYLEKTFGLVQTFELAALEEWIRTPVELSAFEKQELTGFQEILRFNVLHWNEQELSLHFIGPMFSIAKLTSQQYNFFAQRFISAAIGDVELSGKPDGILASGYRSPEKPYFAFQEYKKERDPEGDPAGQALAAMLVGQSLNDSRHPIYGCYVNGRDWYFMTLDKKQYAISQGFDTTIDHIFDVLRILKALKGIVVKLIAASH